jgi:hypothetical protein
MNEILTEKGVPLKIWPKRLALEEKFILQQRKKGDLFKGLNNLKF